MKKDLVYSIIFLITLGSIILGLYITGGTNDTKSGAKIKIATTIFPLYDITKNIAEDKLEIIQILPSGASPHTYEPTLKDQSKLSDVDLVFAIGYEFDSFTTKLAEDANPSVKIVTVDNNIRLTEWKSESHEDDEQSNFDPHYWLSISNAKIITKNIADELSELDPNNRNFYISNYEKYINELDAAKNTSLEKISNLNNKKIITFHSAFSYFAEDMGLEVVATIEEFPGQEPSLSYIAAVGELIEENNVKVLFKEPQLPESIVKALADDYGVSVETLDPLGGIEGRDSYIKTFYYNIETIVEAMK